MTPTSSLHLRVRSTALAALRDLAMFVVCLAIAGAFIADIWRAPSPEVRKVVSTGAQVVSLA